MGAPCSLTLGRCPAVVSLEWLALTSREPRSSDIGCCCAGGGGGAAAAAAPAAGGGGGGGAAPAAAEEKKEEEKEEEEEDEVYLLPYLTLLIPAMPGSNANSRM